MSRNQFRRNAPSERSLAMDDVDSDEAGYPGNDAQSKASSKTRRRKSTKRSSSVHKSDEMDDNFTASYFSLCVTGQIVSATFPLGPDKEFIFCRYELVAGPDWQLASGAQHGLTQMSTNKSGHFNDKIVFNMPIEVTYKSTSPFGWPQILISVFGQNGSSAETLLGYAHAHLPVFGSQRESDQSSVLNEVPILMPRCQSMLADVTSWLLRRQPELKDPKVLLDNLQSKGLCMESYGTLELQLHTIMRGARKLGYHWHA
ncbi:B9 domain-containing protein 1 [Drosophila albomicans]|uniref:B9 domain-containing protein 1 n=1 Tax=Drosophila albomicans TaxID=7291 RepID=A0A6P8Z9G6_DROAB|nr:B9 domain-containing protein 1 [Drosophila albomicans]XP_034113032.1 B9 domain-containing protein 1 [Drosophila albomicans]XP_051863807.1 B9 domain-containing protein 1 [Drosophila albomicans]XP_051863808.1 B9 domain-containing protein 1 [Drosophila albomicans]